VKRVERWLDGLVLVWGLGIVMRCIEEIGSCLSDAVAIRHRKTSTDPIIFSVIRMR